MAERNSSILKWTGHAASADGVVVELEETTVTNSRWWVHANAAPEQPRAILLEIGGPMPHSPPVASLVLPPGAARALADRLIDLADEADA